MAIPAKKVSQVVDICYYEYTCNESACQGVSNYVFSLFRLTLLLP